MNDEIAQIAGKLAADENLSEGFNAVGFSQGGQFLRAYTEMYNNPRVYSLITMGGQHQGVYGIPDCLAPNVTLCEVVRDLLDLGAYIPIVQEVSVQAQYWHDPLNEELYRENNIFLPNINNDGTFNQTYKDNMLSLENFVMVQFMNDTVVIPRESEWFGFYAPGQDSEILPLEDSPLYIEDWLGLQELDNTGRYAGQRHASAAAPARPNNVQALAAELRGQPPRLHRAVLHGQHHPLPQPDHSCMSIPA